MGRPKTRRNKGGATAHSEVEENYEDTRGSDIDAAKVVDSTAGEESSQDDRSEDGSIVKNKPFQFSKGVQPSRRKLAQQEANAFCIQITITSEERGQTGMPPPRYAWSEVVIRDIVQAWLPTEIHEVLITVPGEAIIFFTPRSQKRGLSREDAMELATHFPSQKHWVGKAVAITSRVINLFTARGYCHAHKMAREGAAEDKDHQMEVEEMIWDGMIGPTARMNKMKTTPAVTPQCQTPRAREARPPRSPLCLEEEVRGEGQDGIKESPTCPCTEARRMR